MMRRIIVAPLLLSPQSTSAWGTAFIAIFQMNKRGMNHVTDVSPLAQLLRISEFYVVISSPNGFLIRFPSPIPTRK